MFMMDQTVECLLAGVVVRVDEEGTEGEPQLVVEFSKPFRFASYQHARHFFEGVALLCAAGGKLDGSDPIEETGDGSR